MKKTTYLFFAMLMSALSWQGIARTGSICDNPIIVANMSFNDSVNTSSSAFPDPYCNIADADDVVVEEITKVIFDDTTITNADANSVLIDKTDTIVNAMAGETYTITVEGNTYGNFDTNIVAFIDWNQNNILDDAGEIYILGTLANSTGSDGISATMDILVPADAVLGETRIRITKTYTDEDSVAEINPCGIEFDAFGYMIMPGFGQALDFTLEINAANSAFPDPYCNIADADDVIVEEITKVVFDDTTITNTDANSVLIDKTDTIVNAMAGETYTITVEGNTYGNFDTNIVAFIDWNQNNILDDAGEIYILGTLANSTGSDGISATMDILVPADAVLGETRIRITKTYFDGLSDAIITPCGIEFDPFGWGIEAGYGQALDFTLNIEVGNIDDCTGKPDGGIATVSPETGEVNTTYTVSATGFATGAGLTYQWQSNTDGAGWLNEGTAENSYSSYMATAASESGVVIVWRLEVICTLSVETSYSTTATFTTTEPPLYCTPILDCTDGDNITNVTFQEIDNTTTCSPNGYGDYTNMVATVGPGNEYPISVSVGDGWNVESVSVWIDFDDNGSFDEEEFFFIGTGSDETLTNTITIPNNATNGDYRMRVRVAAILGSSATWDKSCDSEDGYGETEDYTITVDETLSTNDFSVSNFQYYPNPMTDVLHISANEDIKSVSVFNMLGQEVLSNKHFTNGEVETTSLSTGTYLFRVTFDNGHVENFKVIKK